MSGDRERRERGADAADAVTTRAPLSPTQALQRSLGNHRLLQLRARLAGPVQRRADGGAGDDAADVEIPGGGSALHAAVQTRAESELGIGLGDVRVVTGDAACSALGAHAFTTHEAGQPTVVMSSAVDLAQPDGQFTLMHELAHVAQQKRGQADSLEGMGGDGGTRDTLESDADRVAARVLGLEGVV